jgi:hypothetical protein
MWYCSDFCCYIYFETVLDRPFDKFSHLPLPISIMNSDISSGPIFFVPSIGSVLARRRSNVYSELCNQMTGKRVHLLYVS